jgi:hypothetical protein
LLELDDAGSCQIGKYLLKIDPELGVVINETAQET